MSAAFATQPRSFAAPSPTTLRRAIEDDVAQLHDLRDRISRHREEAAAVVDSQPAMHGYLITTTLHYALAQAEEAMEALRQVAMEFRS